MNQLTNDSAMLNPDYRDLFLQERERNETLNRDLIIAQAECKTFSRELSNIYQQTKVKRRELAATNSQLVKYANDLRRTIGNLKGAHKELQDAYYDTIHRLVLASEYKDKDTGNHISRMSRYSALIASKIGFSENEVEKIAYAAPMHDVGKIGIPDNIVLKNGMLTKGEFSVIKTHTTIGAGILENSRARVLQLARIIALSHHEKWNGNGYPEGLSGDQIPLSARIVALSDAFDALTSKRPYKSPYPIDVSVDIIRQERGKHFDPEIVDVFINSIDEITAIKNEIDEACDTFHVTEFTWSERDLHAQISISSSS